MEEAYQEVSNEFSASQVRSILEELAGGAKTPRIVKFFTSTTMDVVASKLRGHRVYVEEPYILVKYSQNDDAISRPVTDADIKRFPELWEKYKKLEEKGNDPLLSLLPACTPALERELSDQGITTIQQFLESGLDDERFEQVRQQAVLWTQLNDPPPPAGESTGQAGVSKEPEPFDISFIDMEA